MSTAIFEVARNIPKRSGEVNRLLNQAREHEFKDAELYNSLCRACCVLIASHLEGFLKELTKGLIRDLLYHHQTFGKMPTAMKRAFCEKIALFERVPQREIEDRIKQLIEFFDRNSVPIEMDAFIYKNSPNKNTTTSFIDASLSKVGVPSVLSSLDGSKLDLIFSNSAAQNFKIARDLRRFCSFTYEFPYKKLPQEYVFSYGKEVKNTLWHTLIEEVLTRRHLIAHGDTMNNPTDHNELNTDMIKIETLMQGILHSSSAYLMKSV